MRQMNPDSSTVAGYSRAAPNLLILVSGSTTFGAHKVLLTSTEGNFGKMIIFENHLHHNTALPS